MPFIILLLHRNLAENRKIDVFLHVLAITNLGVQRQNENEEEERYQKTDEHAHQHIPYHIRRNRAGIDSGLVDDACIAFNGWLTDQKFFPATQKSQIKLLFDSLYAGNIIEVQLPSRDLPDLVTSPLAGRLHGLQFLSQGTDIGGEELVQIALERTLLQMHILNHRIIRRAGFLILVQFKDQIIESGYGPLDILVIDIDGEREQPVLGIGIRNLHQILSMRNLRHDAFCLLGRLDTCGNIILTVVFKIQDLVIPLEARDLGLLGPQFGIQLRNTGIDII